MSGALSTHGNMRSAYKISVARTEAKGKHGRNRHRREDNVEMGLKEQGVRMWTGFS